MNKRGSKIIEVELQTPMSGGLETLTLQFENGNRLTMIGRVTFNDSQLTDKRNRGAKEASYVDLISEERRLA